MLRIADDRLAVLGVIRLHVAGDTFDDPKICIDGDQPVPSIIFVEELVRRLVITAVSGFCCCGS